MTINEASVAALTGLAFSGWVWVLGQATPLVNGLPEGAGTAIAGITGGAFCVWHSWYITTRVMPEKDKLHADTINKIVADFREEMKEQRAATERLFDMYGKQK